LRTCKWRCIQRGPLVLEPETRELLLDSLRPPAGYSLDRAVGTTFSLDLHALLVAPLAFALFDTATDEGRPDPVALLEAVRRHAERIDIFCQAGQIALPARFERVLAYVEASVHQVAPDTPGYIFHPKIWVLRFVGTDGDVRFRLLCLTRNLTFAQSWDTIVALESDQSTARGNGRPLADFIRALPDLAPRALPPGRRQAVLELASEVADAAFLPPAPFGEVAFLPLGIKRHRRTSLPLEGGELRLVVSPFLGHQASEDFGASSTVTLVSRSETFDALPVASLAAFDPYVITSDALGPVDDDAEVVEATSDTAAERAGCPLRGLHAKLFLAERGWDARVWTGSANATRGAFNGNVEFLVELRGRRSACGLEAMLGDSGVTFKTLLEPYARSQNEPVEKTDQELLEERLDVLRHTLAGVRFVATVERAGDDETFELSLAVAFDRLPEADGRVWPISLSHARAKPLADAMAAGAHFGEVSFDRLTSFFAVELTLREGETTATAQFVVNAELEGMPEDRGDRLLGRLLESREKVLRYLLMLLAEDGFAADGSGPITRLIDALDHANAWQDSAAVPLLESLLKALARDPKRLDHVAGLAESLRATPEGAALLPDGFEEVWEPIWTAKTEIA
jgi:hypothetical protein